jgi:hypothetical protein
MRLDILLVLNEFYHPLINYFKLFFINAVLMRLESV